MSISWAGGQTGAVFLYADRHPIDDHPSPQYCSIDRLESAIHPAVQHSKVDEALHELNGMVHWHEPKSGERAGFGKFDQPKSDYDRFRESEGLPISRGVRVRKVQDLPWSTGPAWEGVAHSSSFTEPKANGAATSSKYPALAP